MKAANVDTPHYVLLAGSNRIGPQLAPMHSGAVCTAIFAFSNRQRYEAFRANYPSGVTPYPLVNDYLRDMINQPNETVKLVIVDAASPHESQFHAATVQSVLQANETGANSVSISFNLLLDPETRAYQVEKTAVSAHD